MKTIIVTACLISLGIYLIPPKDEIYNRSFLGCMDDHEWICLADSECEFEEAIVNNYCERLAFKSLPLFYRL